VVQEEQKKKKKREGGRISEEIKKPIKKKTVDIKMLNLRDKTLIHIKKIGNSYFSLFK